MPIDLTTPPTEIEVAELVSLAGVFGAFGRPAALTARRLAIQRGRLTALAAKAITFAMHGRYDNGVTDPTGTIDEGDVMASEQLSELETEAAALGIVIPGVNTKPTT